MSRRADIGNVLDWLREGALQTPRGFDAAAKGDEEFDRLALLFQSVFYGRDGEAVLEVLLDATVRRSPVDHSLGQAEYLRYAQLREGQNSAVAIILTYLDRAEQMQRTNHAPGRTASTGSPGPSPSPFPTSAFYDGLDPEPEPDAGPFYRPSR